jgi:hypothetical protein
MFQFGSGFKDLDPYNSIINIEEFPYSSLMKPLFKSIINISGYGSVLN